MVPLAKASNHPVTHWHWYSRCTKWPSQYTDAPSDHPVLKSTHPVRYCVVQTQASDEPLSWFWSVSSYGAEAILLARLCMIWIKASDEPLSPLSDHLVPKPLKLNQYCYQTLRHQMNRCLWKSKTGSKEKIKSYNLIKMCMCRDMMDMVRWVLGPEWVLDITISIMNVVMVRCTLGPDGC
jgi:hypothetical protein